MLLLSLAENAINHGPAAGHRGEVRVTIRESANAVEIEIENPGRFGGEREGSVGVPLLKRRLEGAYSGTATFALEGRGQRTLAKLVLPRVETGRGGSA